jgi:hypothetical protein
MCRCAHAPGAPAESERESERRQTEGRVCAQVCGLSSIFYVSGWVVDVGVDTRR